MFDVVLNCSEDELYSLKYLHRPFPKSKCMKFYRKIFVIYTQFKNKFIKINSMIKVSDNFIVSELVLVKIRNAEIF